MANRFGANPTNGGAWPEGVIKALNVSENGVQCFSSDVEARQMDKLALKAKEVFGDSVVIRVALAAHTGDLENPSTRHAINAEVLTKSPFTKELRIIAVFSANNLKIELLEPIENLETEFCQNKFSLFGFVNF